MDNDLSPPEHSGRFQRPQVRTASLQDYALQLPADFGGQMTNSVTDRPRVISNRLTETSFVSGVLNGVVGIGHAVKNLQESFAFPTVTGVDGAPSVRALEKPAILNGGSLPTRDPRANTWTYSMVSDSAGDAGFGGQE